MFNKAYQAISFVTLLSLTHFYMKSAHADLFSDYVSTETQEIDQRRTVGSGSRSNCKSKIAENSISLLVPEQKVVHHTSLARPSFFLISNKLTSPEILKFTLVNTQSGKTLVEKSIVISEKIKEINLPKSTRLQLNQIYIWNIGIPCSNNPEEYREVLTSSIKRTEASRNVQDQISRAKNNIDIAAIYSMNGFWYEALSFAIKEQRQNIENGKIDKNNYLGNFLHNVQQNYSLGI